MIPASADAQELGGPVPVQNIGVRPSLLKNVGLDQKLNAQIPLNLTFTDERGSTVQLNQYFGSKPVILTLVYYNCPMLCTRILDDLDESLRQVPLNMGQDYNVVTVSIDPTDTSVMSASKHQLYTGIYGRKSGINGWHFLTGKQPEIKALAAAVGFRYTYDPESKQFAHASGIMIATPQGKLSRYFYGITYRPIDLRLALDQASNGTIGSPVDAVLLFCCVYNPATGKYGVIISHVIQLAGGVTLLLLGGLIFVLLRREHYGTVKGHA
ncbi:MAG TPA: SCO family protein [Candidatus Acidoferrum sp.]|nr:SCO family protein [Candidatus Acidoferrum sp.]